MTRVDGGTALVAALVAHGVDTVFGIPGTHNLAIYAALAAAARPGIIAGGGCRDAAPELVRLAERLGTPVVTSTNGKGDRPGGPPARARRRPAPRGGPGVRRGL